MAVRKIKGFKGKNFPFVLSKEHATPSKEVAPAKLFFCVICHAWAGTLIPHARVQPFLIVLSKTCDRK